ncbi:hypothetical protein D3C72_1856850 [compost metagenome]
MIAQEHDIRALHGASDAFAFADVQRQAVVVLVDGQAPVETHCVLRQGGVQPPIRRERQRGGIGHVCMQHTGLAGDAMDGGVDEHGRGFDVMTASELVAVGVDQHDVVRLHFVPHQAARVKQEMVGITGKRHAEVVADAFAQAVGGGGPQRQRQVGPQCGDGFGVK